MFGGKSYIEPKMIKAQLAFPMHTISLAQLIPYVKSNFKVDLSSNFFDISLPFIVKTYICIDHFKHKYMLLLWKEGLYQKR